MSRMLAKLLERIFPQGRGTIIACLLCLAGAAGAALNGEPALATQLVALAGVGSFLRRAIAKLEP